MSIERVHRASIEALVKLFRQKQINAAARSVVRGARYLSYDIRIRDPLRYTDALTIAEPLALALGVRGVAAYRDGGVLRYDITLPNSYWETVHYSQLTGNYQIGIMPGSKPVSFNISDPNQMIVGVPGSGKSEGIKTILLSLLSVLSPDEFKFVLVDPHRSIIEFNDSNHLAISPASEKEEIAAALKLLHSQLTIRKRVGEAAVKADNEKYPILMLVIDEASEPNVLGAKEFPNKDNIAIVQQLAKEGRKFKMRVLLGTQKPTEADLPGIMSILPVRYVGQVTDARMAANFAGKKEVPAHLLTGNGDFFRSAGDELIRFQFALAGSGDFNKVPSTGFVPLTNTPVAASVGTISPAGRPAIEIEPEKIAYYLHNERVTMAEAKNKLGLSRAGHEKHRDFSLKIAAAMKELNNDDKGR